LRESRAFRVLVRLNAVSTIGASIGLVSMLLVTWFTRSDWVYAGFHSVLLTEHMSFFELLTVEDPGIALFAVLFLVGTLLAIFVPASVLIQAAGVLGLVIGVQPTGDLRAAEYEFGAGYYLGLVSTFVVFMSCKAGYGGGAEARRAVIPGRIAALSPNSTRLRD
jgi:hypothetical protein